MFAPIRTWRRWYRKVNRNQRRYAIVSAIASIEQTVICELGAVEWAAKEFRFHIAGLVILRPGTGAFAGFLSRLTNSRAWGSTPSVFTLDRILAVRAEVANVFSGGSVNDQDAAITISIGDVEVVRFWIDNHVRGPERFGRAVDAAIRVVAIGTFRARSADLKDEGAVSLKFEDLRIVAKIRGPGILAVKVDGLAVARNINEVVLVDVDAVLACGPSAAVLFRVALILQEARVARAAPGLEQFAGLIELKNGRRGHAAAVQLAVRTRETEVADRASASVLRSGTLHSTVGGANGTRTVIDPDMIVLIDSDTTDVTNDPMMRQRLRPRRIEHKAGRSSFGSFVLGHAL